MKKLQIVIIILAVLSVAGLYSLPRVVVDDDEEASAGMINPNQPEEALVDHSTEIPAEALPLVTQWKTALYTDGIIGNNETALDSLMLIFKSVNKYDSAAYYAGQFAERYPGEKTWRKAGDSYYEAFTFAIDEAKSQLMSNNARLYYDKILDSGVKDLSIKNNIAMLLVNSSVPMQGITMLREILAEQPDNAQALFNMGILSLDTKQFDRALGRFQDLIEYHPDHIQGHFFLGVSYFETGDPAKAKAQFEKIKEMNSPEWLKNAADEYLERIE